MHAPFDKAGLCSVELDLLECYGMLFRLDSRELQQIDPSRGFSAAAAKQHVLSCIIEKWKAEDH